VVAAARRGAGVGGRPLAATLRVRVAAVPNMTDRRLLVSLLSVLLLSTAACKGRTGGRLPVDHPIYEHRPPEDLDEAEDDDAEAENDDAEAENDEAEAEDDEAEATAPAPPPPVPPPTKGGKPAKGG
jgi:hypothetical protein